MSDVHSIFIDLVIKNFKNNYFFNFKYSLIALFIGLVALCVAIYIAFNTMYKYTDDLNNNYEAL